MKENHQSRMKYICIKNAVTPIFRHLGRVIGRHPFYFIVISFIISAVLSTGLMKTKLNQDLNYLLYADRGKTFESKQYIKKMFPMNTSDLFVLEKIIDRPRFPVIYILSKKGGNMLKKDILLEIENLQELAKNFTIIFEGTPIRYSDICAVVVDRCFENPITQLIANMDDVISKKIRFKFPLNLDPLLFVYQLYFINFGGVTTDKDGYVQEAKAIRLMYPLDESNSVKAHLIKEWTKKFLKFLETYDSHYIEVYLDPVISTELGIMKVVQNCKPLIGIAAAVISTFSIISFMTNNCVKSKPWLGVAAVISAGLAIAAGFGLMTMCGVENIEFNIILPFLIIATEVDDAFVLVACWRITNHQESVEKRMEETYSNAAVSITITSLTNILSYCIGMSAQFPSLRIFCFYVVTCIFFTYVFQITFFGGCLALSGYREEKGVHPFWCTVVTERFRKYNTHEDEEGEFCMNVFTENLIKFLSYPVIKVIIILLFFINLSIGISGVMYMNEGLNVLGLFPSDSKITASFRTYYNYFTEYSAVFHIVIDKPLDYSDIEVQRSVEDLMTKFESHPNIAGSDLEFSWLKYFKEFQKMSISKYLLSGYDLFQKQDFIDALRDVFFKVGLAKQFQNDVIFNENYTEIISSRFLITATNISNRDTEIRVLTEIQKIADESPYPIIIYSFISSIVEQGIIIKQLTFQLFWLTSILIFVVLFAFIPNLYSTFVAICVLSIIVETVGYMTFWDINLDLASLLILILCMGFSINYPTHVCYAFLSSTQNTVKDKLKDCLHHVSFPIVQGTLTTILGPLIMLYTDMYFYTTFVKIVIIIAVQTSFHALFVIPVMISTISLCSKSNTVNRLIQFRLIQSQIYADV